MSDLNILPNGSIGYIDSNGDVAYVIPPSGIASKAQLDTISTMDIFFKNPRSISQSVTVPDDAFNYMIIGPINVDSSVILTVEGNLVIG